MSTGVDMESGIMANTSVQIQHVFTGCFLQHNDKLKFGLIEDKPVEPEGPLLNEYGEEVDTLPEVT